MKPTKVNILGTEYTIIIKDYKSDEAFKRKSIDGYCDTFSKLIVVVDLHTHERWQHESKKTIETAQREIIRHEIVHAFFGESGLADSTFSYDGAWAKNEEMIDWIALQGVKIYKAWKDAEAV